MSRVPQQSSGVTTALIYTRVSSDEQASEGVSLDAQLSEAQRYAAAHGWSLGKEYQDVMTGKRDDRPQYQRMLSDLRRLHAGGSRVVVIVAALDRLGRRLLEQVRCREEMKTLGVSVHSVRDGGEVSDLVANVLASVAQEEVRRLSERCSASHRYVAAKGWRKVGWVAWGYQWRDATPVERSTGAPAKVLEFNETEAPYVREAFQRAADGGTIRAVSIWIAGLPEAVRGGRTLSYPAVRRILMAPVYIARPQGGTADDSPGHWPALVDDETWRRVQSQIASHARIPRQASGRYLLTGFLRCQKCGSRMSGASERRIPARYRCRATDRGAAASNPRCSEGITAAKLEVAVLSQIEDVVNTVTTDDAAFMVSLRREWRAIQEPAPREGPGAKTIQALTAVVAKAQERLKRAAVLLVDGDIDRPGYELLRDQAHSDLEAAQAELDRLGSVRAVGRPVLPPLDEVLSEAGGWMAALRGGDVIAAREVLGLLVSRIEPIRISHGKFDAAIGWTPLGETIRAIAAMVASEAA
jgi:DNA invertase Pin-like site-specific DNA recombinase